MKRIFMISSVLILSLMMVFSMSLFGCKEAAEETTEAAEETTEAAEETTEAAEETTEADIPLTAEGFRDKNIG